MTAGATTTPPSLRRPALDRQTALGLAATEYDRFVRVLRSLDEADWQQPTDCPAWDVRAVAGHVLGMAEMAASVRAIVAQNVGAARAGGGIDALTAAQVRGRAGLSTAEVIRRLEAAAPRAVRSRRRLARIIGRLPIPEDQVVGDTTERWSVAFLLDVILTRDTWMHRVDVARATGAELQLTPEHDGRIVADVVAEWASRHGAPYRLTLSGPAGGTWASGDGPPLDLDAVEFCRVLSGRGVGAGLLTQAVPF